LHSSLHVVWRIRAGDWRQARPYLPALGGWLGFLTVSCAGGEEQGNACARPGSMRGSRCYVLYRESGLVLETWHSGRSRCVLNRPVPRFNAELTRSRSCQSSP